MVTFIFYCFFAEINECAEFVDICHKHGQCINTVGSYQCICNNGWTGVNCSVGKSNKKSLASLRIPSLNDIF